MDAPLCPYNDAVKRQTQWKTGAWRFFSHTVLPKITGIFWEKELEKWRSRNLAS